MIKEFKENIKVLIENGRTTEAKALLEEYKKIEKDDVDIYSMNGIIAMMEGRMDDAKNFLKAGIEVDENNFDILYNLGYLYEIKREKERAIAYYKLAKNQVITSEQKSDIRQAVIRLDEYTDSINRQIQLFREFCISSLKSQENADIIKETEEKCLHTGRRAKSFEIKIGNDIYVQKIFEENEIGLDCFEKEKEANERFSKYIWFDKWVDFKKNSFVRKYYNENSRIDLIGHKLKKIEREKIAGQVLSAILDLYVEGFAHRDIHSRNLYYVDDEIKLIDFETLCKYEGLDKLTFDNSYDVTGVGLESPFLTGNMGFLSRHPLSVSNILGISFAKAKDRLKDILLEELREASITFQKRAGRHVTKSQRIYSSFTVSYFSVKKSIAQRDCELRLKSFKVDKEDIQDKTILDLGSNIGGMIFETQKFKPQRSLGIEYDESKVHVANRVAAFSNLKDVHFQQGDIDFLTLKAIKGKYDVTFCLAIEAHVKKPDRLYDFLAEATNELLLFEGNATTDINEVRRKLKDAGFKKVEYLGVCDDDYLKENNCRPIFKAWK